MTAGDNCRFIGKQWLPVIAWMALIFLFSSQPHSGAITQLYFGNLNVPLRKCGHLLEYFVLCLLSERAFRLSGGVFSRRALAFALSLSVLYAVSDEWHQQFVPGRSACLADVAVDGLGALFALAWIGRS
jgi:VanZ family protein